jgi:hypothetical protein
LKKKQKPGYQLYTNLRGRFNEQLTGKCGGEFAREHHKHWQKQEESLYEGQNDQ